MNPTEADSVPEPVHKEMTEIVARARAGDATAVPRLRELFAEYPKLWKHYGNLADEAERAWIDLAAGKDLVLRESALRFAENQRTALTRRGASVIEKQLVDQVVLYWIQLKYFANVAAASLNTEAVSRLSAYQMKRQADAQAGYESAVKFLATMQKLLPLAEEEEIEPKSATPPVDRTEPAVTPPSADVSEKPAPDHLKGTAKRSSKKAAGAG